ncbi:pectinesterase inhibitor 10-like [Humulus lupulus]|uniref:pectinesterase inhibitor 10-like n=1 Tax=Humulus lupulus TaxID=3486 RepID=UPI002B4024E9|nr:pectinesterase inhibitor 10-like [Humulus lupulus]
MATKTRAQRRKSKPSSTPPPTKKSTKVPSSSPPPAKKKSTDPSSVPPPAKQIPFVPNTTPLPLPSPATVNDLTTITTKPATKTTPTIQKSKRPAKPASAAPPPKTQKTSVTTKATPHPKPTVVLTPSTKKNLVLSGSAKKFVSAQARAKYESIKTNKLLPEKGFLPTIVEVLAFISDVIEQHNWETSCKKPKHAIIPLVLEFYANMASSANSEVIVRGKVVSFSSEAINSVFGLDSFECAVYNDMVCSSKADFAEAF